MYAAHTRTCNHSRAFIHHLRRWVDEVDDERRDAEKEHENHLQRIHITRVTWPLGSRVSHSWLVTSLFHRCRSWWMVIAEKAVQKFKGDANTVPGFTQLKSNHSIFHPVKRRKHFKCSESYYYHYLQINYCYYYCRCWITFHTWKRQTKWLLADHCGWTPVPANQW